MMKMYCNVCNKHRKIKTLEYHMFLKTLGLSIVYSKCGHEYKKYLKKKNQLNRRVSESI